MELIGQGVVREVTYTPVDSSSVQKREIFTSAHETYLCLTPEQGTPVTIHLRESPEDPTSKDAQPFKPGYEVLLANVEKAIKAITDKAGIPTS